MCWLGCLKHPFLLFIRIVWGWSFFQAGMGKFGNIEQVTGFFTNLGLPFPQAQVYLVASVEAVGGICLLLGLASRLVSIPLAITMLVALCAAHGTDVPSLLAGVGPFAKALAVQGPFAYLYTVLVVLFFGAGAFSLDALICKMKCRDKSSCCNEKPAKTESSSCCSH